VHGLIWALAERPNYLGQQRLQHRVTNANNVTTVQLISTSFVGLPPGRPGVESDGERERQGRPRANFRHAIDVQIAATLTNGGTIPVVSNGASCQATATTGSTPK
jgi:hypothetical protein